MRMIINVNRMAAAIIIYYIIISHLQSQNISIEYLSPLPEKVSNNAITSASVDGVHYIYSFAGIDSTKNCGRTHLRCYRMSLEASEWEQLPNLPASYNGLIALGASTVKNNVYIFGGYHVRSNCSEVTSGRTIRFDPHLNDFIADGQPIPKPVDDHIQVVWRDSLIYLISGWSNTTNVTDVQIYNPVDDEWTMGTSVPADNSWRVFGASGSIVGDTIYISGGAGPNCFGTSNCFNPTNRFRKGIINPDQPEEIEWLDVESENAIGYRMGSTTFNEFPIWIGGAENTYNFDGIAYDGSGGVAPNQKITYFDIYDQKLKVFKNDFLPIMDLRGVAKISDIEFILIGGMKENQEVTDEVVKIKIDALTSSKKLSLEIVQLYPNPTDGVVRVNGLEDGDYFYRITNVTGDVLSTEVLHSHSIELRSFPSGVYIVEIFSQSNRSSFHRIVKF